MRCPVAAFWRCCRLSHASGEELKVILPSSLERHWLRTFFISSVDGSLPVRLMGIGENQSSSGSSLMKPGGDSSLSSRLMALGGLLRGN